MVSEEALKEFKAIYKEEYGVDLDDKTATDLAVNLLTLFDKIYRPLKREWFSAEELKVMDIKNNKNGSNVKY